jgi:hypothetical protein
LPNWLPDGLKNFKPDYAADTPGAPAR